jgi:hypothetical protein
MSLSSNMIDFQKERMKYIVIKEADIKKKEEHLLSLQECNNNMEKYKLMLDKLTNGLSKSSDELNVLVKYANSVNNAIKKEDLISSQTDLLINNNHNHNHKPTHVVNESHIPNEHHVVNEHNLSNIYDFHLSPEEHNVTMTFDQKENFGNLDDNILDSPIDDN